MDVIVVGAGASGLAAARVLHDEGADVVVLEARPRIGGRILTARDLGDSPVELGAMLVHGEHAVTWEIMREAGLQTGGPRWSGGGRSVLVVDGEVMDAADALRSAGVPWWGSAESEIAARSASDRPLTEEIASIKDWSPLRRRMSAEWFAQIWCADPDRLSAEGVGRVENSWASGQQNFVIADGYDRVAEHLAKGLDVRTSSPVHRLRWAPGSVEAHGQLGIRIRARTAVVTIPPTVAAAGRVRFAPALPEWKADAARSIPVGAVTRVAVTLREPAPESASVQILGDGWWRISEGSALVLGWIGGPAATKRRRPWAEEVAKACRPLGWLVPWAVSDVRVADWGADPWSLGGYSYPAVGALDAPATWAEPVADTLFFAGEATCGDRHPATVHGAIESGRRAAAEVLQTLRR